MASDVPRDEAERLGRALVQLTRRPEVRSDDPKALLEQVPAARFVEMACHHRVPGVVYRSLAPLDLEDEEFSGLRDAYQMAALAHGRCLIELEELNRTLEGLAQPWLVVKGPVLAEIGYGDTGARLYGDLDLVVAASDLDAALSRIEAAGGQLIDLNWPMMTKLRRAEIPIMLPAGMLGDLHWHLSVTPNVRSRFRISMAEVVERRRTVTIGGIDVSTLDETDGLLYLCLHGSLSGGHELVWLKDLDQMVETESPDWDELVRRARHGGVDLVAAMQLERARSVLGASVPEEVIGALAGQQPWWRWWQRRERQIGLTRWGGYDRTGRTFVSATSDGSLASAGQLVRSLVGDVIRPAVTDRLSAAQRGRRGQKDDRPPLHRPVGGSAARAEYMRMVSTGDWG
jgi:hypothetical protein